MLVRRLTVAGLIWAALVMLTVKIAAQDVVPLPFSFITVDGRVWAPDARTASHRLSFDADFRLHDSSNGLSSSDSLSIETYLAYPTMAANQDSGPQNLFTLPLVRMILRVSVDENCFEDTEQGFRFELTPNNRECVAAMLDLAEVSVPSDIRSRNGPSQFLDLTPILRELEVRLTPRDNQGRWRMQSRADFFNPGYPFPVVGFGAIPGVGPSGTSIVVGDDGGLAPFEGMVFEGRAGEDPGPCRPVSPRVQGQGFWKRQCKGPHPSNSRLANYLPLVQRTQAFGEVENVADLCSVLSPSPRSDKCEQAEGQFMALLLNLASGRLAFCNCVDDPDLGAVTVAQAVALLDRLLANPNRTRNDCTRVQAIADRMNGGETLVNCGQLASARR